ncbi:hypothetical protein EKO27_g4505 [Xylaria grammica]|uniref:Rhodopsin domain-containing protein n=1 Tax=Xylaria grammica TaxID=363999 RepID=A0A439D875_9PEZI|nr:hypothetical protein EKO27_g4505 [Xylaria grammica]
MAFMVFNSADQTATFFLCIFTTPICILLTLLRFTTTQRRGRRVGLEDWLALAALIIYLVWVGYALAAVILQNGRNVLEAGALPKSTTLAIIQAGYVLDAFYVVNQACAKFSILALYYRIFSANRTFVLWTYGVATVTMLWFISMFIERLLVCNPPAKLWNPDLPGYCVNSQIVIAAAESVNSLLDFVMIGMAIYVVRQLKISASQQLQLSLIFTIGGLAGVIGPIKIAFAYGKNCQGWNQSSITHNTDVDQRHLLLRAPTQIIHSRDALLQVLAIDIILIPEQANRRRQLNRRPGPKSSDYRAAFEQTKGMER